MQSQLLKSIQMGMVLLVIIETIIQCIPSGKYVKYARLIAGVIFTAFCMNTVMQLVGNEDTDSFFTIMDEYENDIGKMQEKAEEQSINGENYVISTTCNQIKSKINNYISVDNYKATKVEITENKGLEEESYAQQLDGVVLKVYMSSNEKILSTIQVDKVKLQGDNDSKAVEDDNYQTELKNNLRYEISRILETKEDNVEVILE